MSCLQIKLIVSKEIAWNFQESELLKHISLMSDCLLSVEEVQHAACEVVNKLYCIKQNDCFQN